MIVQVYHDAELPFANATPGYMIPNVMGFYKQS